jgi:hypothetical protein
MEDFVPLLSEALLETTAGASSGPVGMMGNVPGDYTGTVMGWGNALLSIGLALLVTIEMYKVARGSPADFLTPIFRVIIAAAVMNALIPIGSFIGSQAEIFANSQLQGEMINRGLASFMKVFEVKKLLDAGLFGGMSGMAETAASPAGIVFYFGVIVSVLVIIVKYVLIDFVWSVLFVVVVATGAIAVPAGVLPGSKSFGGWIKNLFEIALWPVVFKLLVVLMITIQGATIDQILAADVSSWLDKMDGSSVIWVVIKALSLNVAFGVIIVMTPYISRMIVRSESAAAVGSFATGMSLAAVTYVVSKVDARARKSGGNAWGRFKDEYLGGQNAGSVLSQSEANSEKKSRDDR